MASFTLPETSNLISLAREILYGDSSDWLPLMASELSVREDTIRQWHSGRRTVPRHTVEELQALLDEKRIRADVYRKQLAEVLPALKCQECGADISILYKPEGLRSVICASGHLFHEDPQKPGSFRDVSQIPMPDLAPEDQVLIELDAKAEEARQNWLRAGRRNAGRFATAYREQRGPALDQIEDAIALEKIYRDLHAQRLDAYRQRFASVREVISSGAGMGEGVPLDVMGPADLTPGAKLTLRFSGGLTRSGHVVAIEDAGTRAVVEVAGKRWWLHRRSAMHAGGVARHAWAVGGPAFQ